MSRFLSILSFALLIPSLLFSEINDHRDFQFWFFDSIGHPISKKDTLFFQGEVRFGDDASKLYLGYGEVLLKHDFSKRFAIVGGYRQQWAKGRQFLKFRISNIPFVDFIGKMEDKQLAISNRTRIEYAFVQFADNTWIFRDQVFISTAKAIGKLKVHPFIFDEVFFVERIGFEQNRLAAGLSWVPNEHANPRLFYMLRHRKDATRGWEYQNVLALFIFLKF